MRSWVKEFRLLGKASSELHNNLEELFMDIKKIRRITRMIKVCNPHKLLY